MIRKLIADLLYTQAQWLLSLGRWGMVHAYRMLRLTVALRPSHPQAPHWLQYLRGRIALERGEPERALELLREAARALPDVPDIKLNLGLASTMAGKHDQAISTLERAMKETSNPVPEEVWGSLAWSYLRSGRPSRARETCRRAFEAGTRSSRLDLIRTLAAGVDVGTLAVSEVQDLLHRVPQGGVLLLDYARMQAHDGRHKLARAAISAFPTESQARAFNIIAHASLNEDDPETAAWAIEQILRAKDESFLPEATLLRSEVYLRRGDFADALAQARKAANLDPQSGRPHEAAGRALLLMGQWDEAVQEMIEALHSGQASALGAGVAALAALATGDLDAARGVFLAERSGDGLGLVASHCAQSLLLATENDVPTALQLAQWAINELLALPAWARQPAVLSHFGNAIRQALQHPNVLADPNAKAAAETQLRRLELLPPE